MIRQSKAGVFTRFLLTVMLSVWTLTALIQSAEAAVYTGEITGTNIITDQNTQIGDGTTPTHLASGSFLTTNWTSAGDHSGYNITFNNVSCTAGIGPFYLRSGTLSNSTLTLNNVWSDRTPYDTGIEFVHFTYSPTSKLINNKFIINDGIFNMRPSGGNNFLWFTSNNGSLGEFSGNELTFNGGTYKGEFKSASTATLSKDNVFNINGGLYEGFDVNVFYGSTSENTGNKVFITGGGNSENGGLRLTANGYGTEILVSGGNYDNNLFNIYSSGAGGSLTFTGGKFGFYTDNGADQTSTLETKGSLTFNGGTFTNYDLKADSVVFNGGSYNGNIRIFSTNFIGNSTNTHPLSSNINIDSETSTWNEDVALTIDNKAYKTYLDEYIDCTINGIDVKSISLHTGFKNVIVTDTSTTNGFELQSEYTGSIAERDSGAVADLYVTDSSLLSPSIKYNYAMNAYITNSTFKTGLVTTKDMDINNSTIDSRGGQNACQGYEDITIRNGSVIIGNVLGWKNINITDSEIKYLKNDGSPSSFYDNNLRAMGDGDLNIKDSTLTNMLKIEALNGIVNMDGATIDSNDYVKATITEDSVDSKTVTVKDSTVTSRAYTGLINENRIEDSVLNFTGNTYTVNGYNTWTGFQADQLYNNTINISNSTINAYDLIGFHDDEYVENCTMTIDGGSTINGNIYLTDAATATNNTLNLYTGNGLTNNTIISANYNYAGVNTGNTLNIKNVLGATAQNIEKFQNINIYVPSTASKNDTILTLTSYNTDLSDVAIKAGIEGDIDFGAGDVITLLKNNNGITTNEGTTYGILTAGVSDIYDGLTVKKNDNTSIILTIPGGGGGGGGVDPDPPVPPVDPDPPAQNPPAPNPAPIRRRVNPEIMSLNAGQAASLELIQQGRELATQIRHAETNEDGIFGVIGTYKGSREDVNTQFSHVIAGWKHSDDEQIAAAYAWYGRGNYDSNIAGIDASGSASAVGIGGLYRKNLPDDLFIEGQLGFGQVKRDYSGKGFSTVIDNTSYDGVSPYFSGAVTFGKKWTLSEDIVAEDMFIVPKDSIEAYLTVAHDRVSGFDAKLSSGEKFDFGDAAQTTVGVGCVYEKDMGKNGKFYAGVEVNKGIRGSVEATYRHGSTGELDLDGITAELNLGWKQEIKDGQSINVALHGMAGARQGIGIDVLYSKAL